ncbi:hypothetical protein [Paraburkholderia youngii]|uniref:hypothetical protein n=1 Tax=Paraburkholderia youngii TaxID=2782701 RepID=UPI003D210754
MSTASATAAQATSVEAGRYDSHPVVVAVREGNRPEHEGQGFFLVLTLRSGRTVRGPSYKSAEEIAWWGAVKLYVHESAEGEGEPHCEDQTFLLDDVIRAEIEW